jgi:glutamyl-tRNA reductase
MDSLVIGETQITGQFKASLDQAKSVGALGQITDRLGQVALAAAKQVRTKTEISKHPVSISHAAIDLAKKVLDRLEGRSVIVVGAGEMAEICCRYLRQNGLERLWVVNRTLESAERLTATLGFGEAHPLQDLTSLMREADLLISSTSAPHTIVRYDEARAVWRARPSRPLVCIDIAVPRDIDPKVGELEDVYLFDIDDLRQIVDENSSKRQEAKKQATVIIRQKADEFVAWMERVPEKQHLGDIHQNVHSYFREELKRSRQRGDLKGFSEPDFALIEVAMHRITQNFLNTLSRKLKQKAYAPSMLSDLFQGLLNSPTEIATEIATLESEDSSPADIPDGRASRSKKGEVS